ncbi:MAG: DUF1501 domain-containing protein [Kiritimatiellia bacterium]
MQTEYRPKKVLPVSDPVLASGAPISRREAMRRGLFITAGFLLADRLTLKTFAAGAPAAAVPSVAKAKAVIQIFLWGGMSHTDTWDPKPDSGYDYTGQFKGTIPTNVNGITISDLFPLLARQADKYSLIRSMTHRNNGHETAAYLMQTGHLPGEQLSYPSIGAVFAMLKGYDAGYKGLIPPYVVLTQSQGRFSESGFLSSRYKPFATGGDPNAARFEVEGVVAQGISDERQKARRDFLHGLNTMGKALPDNPQIAEAADAEKQAYDLILGEGKDVFDLSKEKPELRDRYGRHTFGQDCLVARRLVEAGVPYITINYPGGWDTHSNHFQTMRRQCPQLDQGLAILLQDLSDRGLLDSTAVWCCGEFGRTPKVDWQPPWNGGRGHYGNVFTVLVAGGGFKGGCIVGASDDKGEEVKERPVYPIDLLGSIYELAGINPDTRMPHPLGLEAHVLAPNEKGAKSAGRLKEIM